LTDTVARLARPNSSKVEWSVDEVVTVSEMDPASERDQTMMLGVILGCVRGMYQMYCGKRRGGGDIERFVVLQPEALICGIVPDVIMMDSIEFY
jgi:hypothetical protein